MPTTVTILYNGPKVDITERHEDAVMNICRVFEPTGAYIDSIAYKDTAYDTNVDGWGSRPGLRPMDSTVTPFAWLEQAVLAAIKAEKEGTDNAGVTFTVDDYMQRLYWLQMADNFADQGFAITVSEPAADTSDSWSEVGGDAGADAGENA